MRQRDLPFDHYDDPRERARQERLERILSTTKDKVKTAARLFDYHEATRAAKLGSFRRC